jgi:primosomal replication protein N''
MLTKDLIDKTRQQIGLLYQQTQEIDATNAQIKAAKFKYRDHFNIGMFACNSVSLFDYVKELEENFNALLACDDKGSHQLNFRGERLTQQLTALIQAVRANGVAVKEHHFLKASNKIRFADHNKKQAANKQGNYQPGSNQNSSDQYSSNPSSANQQAGTQFMANSHELYQNLAQHHEFERRLNDMVFERQAQMNIAKGEAATQRQKEVLALHQRLGKCRKAITAIEEQIAFKEGRNNNTRR